MLNAKKSEGICAMPKTIACEYFIKREIKIVAFWLHLSRIHLPVFVFAFTLCCMHVFAYLSFRPSHNSPCAIALFINRQHQSTATICLFVGYEKNERLTSLLSCCQNSSHVTHVFLYFIGPGRRRRFV